MDNRSVFKMTDKETGEPENLLSHNFKWSREDWFYAVMLIILGAVMMLPGLSIRTLWGSEGRWAVIAREMLESGNYFLPTINGVVYFDKPLLSYWAIVPFSLKSGVTEIAARLPSALAAIGSSIVVFFIGRRLFNSKTGFISGALLLTTFMFLFWSRHASADMLNLLFVWLMFWFFVTGGIEGRFLSLLAIYTAGAIASFLKGPTGASVVIFSMGFYGLITMLLNLHKKGFSYNLLKKEFLEQFRWIISWNGLTAMSIGIAIFLILLFLPVWVTGSWESVQLMWRENVERFFKPFDHVEPAYAYLKHVLVFTAPWTLLMVASLLKCKTFWSSQSGRYIMLTSLGIFLFFTLSGSRRSYYILPLIPALMLITGKAITDWMEKPLSPAFKIASLLTAFFIGASGVALIYLYFNMGSLRHISQLFIAPLIGLGGILSIFFIWQKRARRGIIVLFLIAAILEFWVFNTGMGLAEKQRRDIKQFSLELKKRIEKTGKERVVIFRDVSSSLIFYLDIGRIREIKTPYELTAFRRESPKGLIISDLKNIEALKEEINMSDLETVLKENGCEKRGECLALLRFKSD